MKRPSIATVAAAGSAWLVSAAALHVSAQTPAPASKAHTGAITPPAPSPPPPPPPKAAGSAAAVKSDRTSYLIGLTFGEQMRQAGVTDQVLMNAVTRGIKDGLGGKKSSPEDRQELNAYVRAIREAALPRNQAAAKAFLERNSHASGVTTTASGLQYKILSPGDSQAPPIAPTDQATVQYRGKLLDGTEFDSSYSHGAPATFSVNGVIPGWREALAAMKPGAKWELFVPPELAYGASTRPGIPPGSLLIFDLELLSVKPGSAPAASPPPAAGAAASPASPPASPAPAASPTAPAAPLPAPGERQEAPKQK